MGGAVWITEGKTHVYSLNISPPAGSDEYKHVGKVLMQHVYDLPEYKDTRFTVQVADENEHQFSQLISVGFKPSNRFRVAEGQRLMECTHRDRNGMREATSEDLDELVALD